MVDMLPSLNDAESKGGNLLPDAYYGRQQESCHHQVRPQFFVRFWLSVSAQPLLLSQGLKRAFILNSPIKALVHCSFGLQPVQRRRQSIPQAHGVWVLYH